MFAPNSCNLKDATFECLMFINEIFNLNHDSNDLNKKSGINIRHSNVASFKLQLLGANTFPAILKKSLNR